MARQLPVEFEDPLYHDTPRVFREESRQKHNRDGQPSSQSRGWSGWGGSSIALRLHGEAQLFIMPSCQGFHPALVGDTQQGLMVERTLAIIKPDAVKKNVIGKIIGRCEDAGLIPIAIRKMNLSKRDAEGFYAIHKQRPFFDSLTTFMSSGPIVVMVLAGEDAITRYRDLMGATDPAKADAGTLRALYGTDIEYNGAHGSDSPETARVEIGYFFPEMESRDR